MKNHCYVFVSLLLTGLLYGQTDSRYYGIKSKGQIPEEFTKSTIQKIAEAQDDSGLENMGVKDKDKFFEMTNFGIDDLLQSGQVCFGDTISKYVESVLSEIRLKNPDIPSEVRVYTIKSPVVNAYTTDQGIIFVNTGLLAQLENEAQLAFVICHELVHYMERHVRESFVADVMIERGGNEYRTVRNVDKKLASAKFSRKLESEADIEGLGLFLNTDYNPNEIDGVFDVLLYSYLPFDEIPFDSSILELGNYQLPDRCFLEELADIEADEDADDSEATHPNIRKRRLVIEDLLTEIESEGKDFILPKDEFFGVRAAARYEVLRLQLISGEYSEALYSAFLLQKEFPESMLPKLAIGEILFGVAKFANSHGRKKVVGYYKKKQGSVQQVYYLLSKLKPEEITLLAIRYNYYLLEKFPDDEYIKRRIVSLFEDMCYEHEFSFSKLNFDTLPTADVIKNDTKQEDTKLRSDGKAESKYDRIKRSRKRSARSQQKASVTKWAYKDLFIGCEKDTLFSIFEAGRDQANQKRYRTSTTDNSELNKQSVNERREYAKMVRKHGRSLGIDKLVLVDPYYIVFKANKSKDEAYKFKKSEQEELEQLEHFDFVAEKAGLELDILTSYTFEQDDVQRFNDFSLLNEWVSERFMMGDRTTVTSSSEEVKEMVERYGTKYFAWTGIIGLTLPRGGKLGVVLLSAYSIFGIPYGLYYLLTGRKTTSVTFVVFNIETGNLVMYENRELAESDSDGLLMSQYYDMFNQVRREKK